MISAVANQGKVLSMLYQDVMNANTLIKLMRPLVMDTDQKLFLILDSLRVHHSKLVKKWLEQKRDQIEVFFLFA